MHLAYCLFKAKISFASTWDADYRNIIPLDHPGQCRELASSLRDSPGKRIPRVSFLHEEHKREVRTKILEESDRRVELRDKTYLKLRDSMLALESSPGKHSFLGAKLLMEFKMKRFIDQNLREIGNNVSGGEALAENNRDLELPE